MQNNRANDPVFQSVKRMELNLHKLKQIGPYGNPNSIWETAGHIWKAVYWICELTKDAKIKNDAWAVREALGQIISRQNRANYEHFDHAIHKISESYDKIQQRV